MPHLSQKIRGFKYISQSTCCCLESPEEHSFIQHTCLYNMGLLLSTHSLSHTFALCDRWQTFLFVVCCLDDGKVGCSNLSQFKLSSRAQSLWKKETWKNKGNKPKTKCTNELQSNSNGQENSGVNKADDKTCLFPWFIQWFTR